MNPRHSLFNAFYDRLLKYTRQMAFINKLYCKEIVGVKSVKSKVFESQDTYKALFIFKTI